LISFADPAGSPSSLPPPQNDDRLAAPRSDARIGGGDAGQVADRAQDVREPSRCSAAVARTPDHQPIDPLVVRIARNWNNPCADAAKSDHQNANGEVISAMNSVWRWDRAVNRQQNGDCYPGEDYKTALRLPRKPSTIHVHNLYVTAFL
jgi:hypothetical protein